MAWLRSLLNKDKEAISHRSHRSYAIALASVGMTWLLRYWIRIF